MTEKHTSIAQKVTITDSYNSNGYAIEAKLGHRWQFVATIYPIYCVRQDDESGNSHEEPDDIMTKRIANTFSQSLLDANHFDEAVLILKNIDKDIFEEPAPTPLAVHIRDLLTRIEEAQDE